MHCLVNALDCMIDSNQRGDKDIAGAHLQPCQGRRDHFAWKSAVQAGKTVTMMFGGLIQGDVAVSVEPAACAWGDTDCC